MSEWTELTSTISYVKANDSSTWQDGVNKIMAEGVYKGAIQGNGPFKTISFHIKAANGNTYAVNKFGQLDYLMAKEDVKEGDVIRIVYAGTEKLTKGAYKGKEIHTCKIYKKAGENKSIPQSAQETVDEFDFLLDDETDLLG